MITQTLTPLFLVLLVLSMMLSCGLFLAYYSRFGMFHPSFASFDEKCVFCFAVAMVAMLATILFQVHAYLTFIIIIFAQIIPQVAISLYQNYGK